MVHVKANKGSEIRRFEIESRTTFNQLKKSVGTLFGVNDEDIVDINYCDGEEDIVRLSSDIELQSAFKHLGEEDTWRLQILLKPSELQQPEATSTSWWSCNPLW